MKAGHQLGGGVGGVRQAPFEGKKTCSEICESKRTHTLFEYPLGKLLETKNVFIRFVKKIEPNITVEFAQILMY